MAESSVAPPRSYWIISSLALVWNLIGLAAYVSQVTMSEDALRMLPDAQRTFLENTPGWATGAFAIATTAGVLGSLLLLLRNAWAVPLFLISLAAVLAQTYYGFVIANGIEVLGAGSAVLPAATIAIGTGLIWYSRVAKERGWFR